MAVDLHNQFKLHLIAHVEDVRQKLMAAFREAEPIRRAGLATTSESHGGEIEINGPYQRNHLS